MQKEFDKLDLTGADHEIYLAEEWRRWRFGGYACKLIADLYMMNDYGKEDATQIQTSIVYAGLVQACKSDNVEPGFTLQEVEKWVSDLSADEIYGLIIPLFTIAFESGELKKWMEQKSN